MGVALPGIEGMRWGSVVAEKGIVPGSAAERFDAFMTAVLDRRIVPLVGAGVSFGAVPGTTNLIETLRCAVRADTVFTAPGPDCTEFARLAEAIYWRYGSAVLCEKLDIAAWSEVEPTRAHRYLALLAGEGLVTDIVTTNYDCGLEIAWRQVTGNETYTAIHNVEGLTRPRERGMDLRVYKINGCAQVLKEAGGSGEREKAAEAILLTDRQIQQFGKRRWAHDLLRVLLRERQIVFSGFGSDEPQIWHVVMDIFEELSLVVREGGRFVWACGHDDQISFHILQALVAENEARGRKDAAGRPKIEFDNVFSSHDARYFDCPDDRLDAGAFWRRVWLEAILSGLNNYSGPIVDRFVRLITGLRYASHDPQVHFWASVWQEIVGEVFRKTPGGRSWPGFLENGRSDACAPGLLCPDEFGGSTGVYVAQGQEPEYWVMLVLLTHRCAQLRAVRQDNEPRLIMGEGALVVHTYMLAGVESGPEIGRPDETRRRAPRFTMYLAVAASLETRRQTLHGRPDLEKVLDTLLVATLTEIRKAELDRRHERRL